MTKNINWYSLSKKDVLKNLNTDLDQGLNTSDIVKLQEKYGKNLFKKKKDFGIWGKILSQFKSPLIFILLVAGLATIFLHEYTDAIVIFLALLINTAIGTFQENKASKAFEKLSKSQQKHATVIRDGKKTIVLAQDLVPGDIVILEAGMYIPADMRLLEEKNILVNESILTGEWVGVSKETKALKKSSIADKSINKQINMVWMGTLVAGGGGLGVVTEIGDKTEIGKIAQSLTDIEEEQTPIKKNLEKLAKFLSIVVLVALVAIFFLGLLRGEPATEMLLVAIAVAVATMPSGLPAAVTAVLAVGMSQILKKGGLVRNLLAAETLGSTTVILTDKTGTITEAKMHLDKVFTLKTLKEKQKDDEKKLLEMAVLSSDAFIDEGEKAPNELIVQGRPLEKAIILAGIEFGLTQDELFKNKPRIDLLSFESKNGFSASLNKIDNKNILYTTGIPELILDKSTYVYKDGKEIKMTEEFKKEFEKTQKIQSSEGSRFIALAYKKVDWDKIPESKNKNGNNKNILEDMVFVGLLAFSDPIRPDAKEAIEKVRGAGAEVIMITGDNPNTAAKIAEEVGIIKKGGKVLRGVDIDEMTDKQLFDELKTVRVFSRMTPSQKLRISKILQKQGEVVAMTGDGINDAPALQGADIGIAMESGTEVSKEASDLILLKGNFSVITFAVEEGRRVIDNLKKIIGYLLSTSFSEVFLIGGSLMFGMPLPILPTQILWANIIEEGLMNFAFVFEPGEKDLMKRNPRDSKGKSILTTNLKGMIAVVGIITGIFLLVLYWFMTQMNLPIEEVRTFMFVALSIDSIFFALSFKSLKEPLWKEDIFSNSYLIISLGISVLFLLMALFLPPLRDLLSLTVLKPWEIAFLGGVGLFNLGLIEFTKYLLFRKVSTQK